MLHFLLFVVLASAVGCDSGGGAGGSAGSGGPGGTGGVPTPADMVPELLMAHGLRDVWAASTGERFVVGERGMVAGFDGTRWIPADLPELRSIHFNGVYGFAADDVYAVGEDFVVLHYDGSGWTVEETPDIDLGQFPPNDAGLFDVWGSGPNDVYAVGDAAVLRFDGNTWTEMGPSFDDGFRWQGVSGTSASNVFLAGGDGAEAFGARFDGAVWSSVSSEDFPVTSAYAKVFTLGPTIAFFAGNDGRISFWNGTTNVDLDSDTNDDVTDIWGVSQADLYAVTETGELLHYDGGSWSSESNGPGVLGGSLRSLFGVARNDLLVAGTGVHRYDGAAWDTLLAGYDKLPTALWAASSDNALILGEQTFRYDGTSVSLEDFNSVNVGTLTGAWGPADQIIVVNTDGSSFLYDGVNWGERNTNNTEPLSAVWGSANDDVFAVGRSGTILRFNGTVWAQMNSGTSTFFSDVHGTGPNDVYAVGGQGTILHYDGDVWLPQDSGTDGFIQGVHVFDPSTIYALQDDFGPFIGNGANWMPRLFEIAGETQQVLSIDGSASDDFFLASVSPSVNQTSHYDGMTFTRMPAVRPSRVMLAVGPREVLTAFGSGEHYVVRLYVP